MTDNPTPEEQEHRFHFGHACDEAGCQKTPTTYVGDIYYACRSHVREFERLVNNE